MLKTRSRSLIVICLAMLLAACSREPDTAHYVPADASAVAGVNVGALGKKIAWNIITGSKLFREMQEQMPAQNATGAIKGIENAGLDVSGTFFLYSRQQSTAGYGSLLVGIIPLADVQAWEAYISRQIPNSQITKEKDRKQVVLGGGIYAGWTPDLLIIIGRPETKETEHTPNAITAELDRAFAVKTTNPLLKDDRFRRFCGRGHDVSFWINYGQFLNAINQYSQLALSGLSLSLELWNGAILSGGLTFRKGKLSGKLNYFLPQGIAGVAAANADAQQTNEEMIGRLPLKNADMVLALHIAPTFIRAMLEKAGYFGITNVALTTQGLDVDYVLDAFSGDVAMVMNDFMLDAEIQRDSFMGQVVAHKKQKASMSMTYAVSLGKKENFLHLLDMAVKGSGAIRRGNDYSIPLTYRDSMYIMVRDKYAVISTRRSYVDDFLKPGHKPGQHKAVANLYNNPFVFYLDIKTLFNNVDPAVATNPRDSSAIAQSKKLLRDVAVYGGSFTDGAYRYTLDVNFMNKEENSILELLNFFMQMNELNARY